MMVSLAKSFKRLHKYLANKNFLIISITIWTLLQVIVVINYHPKELISDPGMYTYYAQNCAHDGTMYPNLTHYHSKYIFAPGWVNFLILCIKLFGSVDIVPYLNIIFNIIIIYLIFRITLKLLKQESIAYLSVYLYMILPSNWTMPPYLYTEIFYVVLTLSSVYFILKKSIVFYILAGIFIALAYWVRPLATAWIIPSTILLWSIFKKISPIAIYITSIICTCLIIGITTHRNFPDYIYKSSTGGVNLIMGANDLANGLYCGDAVDKAGAPGYLPGLYDGEDTVKIKSASGNSYFIEKYSNKYTYKDCDSIWKSRSIEWIKSNPGKWVSMFPYKTLKLFEASGIYIPTDSFIIKIYNFFIGRITFICLVLLCIYAAFKFLWKDKEGWYLLLPCILCTGMTIITVVQVRYNYILQPYIVIIASTSIKFLYNKYIEVK